MKVYIVFRDVWADEWVEGVFLTENLAMKKEKELRKKENLSEYNYITIEEFDVTLE